MRHFLSIVGLALLVSVGFLGLSNYVGTAYGQSSGNLVASDPSGAGGAATAQVMSLLNRLASINLNGSIFKSPAFISLQDWSVPITPQPVGRPNPYLPTAANARVTASSNPATSASSPKFLVKP